MSNSEGGDVIEAWVCDQPPPGASYQVLRDKWVEGTDGTTVRVILEIRITKEETAKEMVEGQDYMMVDRLPGNWWTP